MFSLKQEPPVRNDDYVDIEYANIVLVEDVDLPALEAGQLKSVNPREGQHVKKDEVIATINDQLAQRGLEEAKIKWELANDKATDNTEVTLAERRFSLAVNEFEKNKPLRKSGSVSDYEYNRSKFSMEASELEITKALRDKRLAAFEAQSENVKVSAATDSIARHLLTSPFDGQVMKKHKHAGEWVNAGETVMRVVRMDKLRAEGLADARAYDPAELDGKAVTVAVELARKRIVELTGKVVFVGLEQQGGKGESFWVWAEIDNQNENGYWILHPNTSVNMRIHLKSNLAPNTPGSTSPKSN